MCVIEQKGSKYIKDTFSIIHASIMIQLYKVFGSGTKVTIFYIDNFKVTTFIELWFDRSTLK